MTYLEVKGNITKSEAATKLGLGTHDTALPQPWVDHFVETLVRDDRELVSQDVYSQIVSSFVWSYEDGNAFGCPRPLTKKALDFLKKFDELEHTHYADETKTVLWIRD